MTCASVSSDSKKVIHRLPCLRYKLNQTIMFRGSGLELTRRWSGTEVRDLRPSDWIIPFSSSSSSPISSHEDIKGGTIGAASAAGGGGIVTIEISLGLLQGKQNMKFEVRPFRPIEGDVTDRVWHDSAGNRHVTPIAAYALHDVSKAATYYSNFSRHWSLHALSYFASYRAEDPIVRDTYMLA